MRTLLMTVIVACAINVGLGLPTVVLAEESAEEAAASLRATEVAFARTMADRDHQAFASFLAEETVFFGGRGEIRGKDAVVTAWAPLYEGPEAPFLWRPETATVLDSGTLGLTSGPIFAPDGTRIGTFNSVWRREPGGSWKVVFDRGCPECECPPEKEAAD